MKTSPFVECPPRCRLLASLTSCLLFLAATPTALAQEPGYLGNLPTAAQVLAHFGDGSDPVQVLGRQAAALNILERRFFRSSALMTSAVQAHPATRRVQQDYSQAFLRLREQYGAAVGGIDDQKQRTWSAMCDNRGLDRPVSLDEVLELVPSSVQTGYEAAYARSDSLVAANRAREEAAAVAASERTVQEEHARTRQAAENSEFRGIALVLLAAGMVIFAVAGRTMHRIGKYRFENMTDGGVVQYATYGAAIRQSLVGKLSAFGLLVGGLTVVAGMVMLLSTF